MMKPVAQPATGADSDGNDISVLLASNRLQITAEVDVARLEKLEKMLANIKRF
jgi:hypothetical protein